MKVTNNHRSYKPGFPPFRYPEGTRKRLTREQKSELLYKYQRRLAQWMGIPEEE